MTIKSKRERELLKSIEEKKIRRERYEYEHVAHFHISIQFPLHLHFDVKLIHCCMSI